MHDNDVWDLVDLPDNFKGIGCNGLLGPRGIQKVTISDGLSLKDSLNKKELITVIPFYLYLEKVILQLLWLWYLILIWVTLMDVEPVFLNGQFFEEVYMFRPKGFDIKGKEDMVSRLLYVAINKSRENGS